MTFRKIVALLLLVLLAVFVVMNLEKATVWLFGIRAEMPVALLVFVKKSKRAKDAKPPA